MALDVTKRLVAEQKSREGEELFRAVASVTADVIWDWNVSTDAIWWSDGLKTVFGHSPEECRRNLEFWKTHVHPDDRERVLRTTQTAMDHRQQTWKDDYRFLRSDGSTAHVEDSGYIIYDHQGNPVRFVGGMTDIRHERKPKTSSLSRLRFSILPAMRSSSMTSTRGFCFGTRARSASTDGRRKKQQADLFENCFTAMITIPISAFYVAAVVATGGMEAGRLRSGAGTGAALPWTRDAP